MRRPKDRDFVETKEGLLFCLVGCLHPPDRYAAYLKYTPADLGKWARGDVFYRRELSYYHVRNVLKTIEFLEEHHPHYVWLDPTSHLRFSFVPREAVATYYVPEERLAKIRGNPADPLEREVRELLDLLTRTARVDPAAFGITGSILLELHNPAFSDIDLLVYGARSALRVKQAIHALKESEIAELPPERREGWRVETARRFALATEDVAHLEARRWNYCMFRGRYVSIHPVRSDEEIVEAYGDERYTPVGPATIEASVTDATESMFLPAVYRVANVRYLEGSPAEVRQVVSFEALFCHVADRGDRIVASGQLERGSRGTCRLIVGSAALRDGGSIRVLSTARDGREVNDT